jgi:hypothetical protein
LDFVFLFSGFLSTVSFFFWFLVLCCFRFRCASSAFDLCSVFCFLFLAGGGFGGGSAAGAVFPVGVVVFSADPVACVVIVLLRSGSMGWWWPELLTWWWVIGVEVIEMVLWW